MAPGAVPGAGGELEQPKARGDADSGPKGGCACVHEGECATHGALGSGSRGSWSGSLGGGCLSGQWRRGVPVRACFWPAVKVVVCGLEKER